jgi:hypothetical protein
MENNKIKTLLYLCLIAAAGSATSHPGCNPQMPALKLAPKPHKPQGGDNIFVVYVNGKEITTLHKPAVAIRRRLTISGCGDHRVLVSVNDHTSGNRSEIHVHLPHGQEYQQALMAQLMHVLTLMLDQIQLQFIHELTSMWGKLKCSKPAVAQVNRQGTIGALFAANLLAEDNIGIIHLHFDGLVGASGLSSGQATPDSLKLGKNSIWVGGYSDAASGHVGTVNAIHSANFITKGNIGTIHIHLPTDLKAGIRRLSQIWTGVQRALPRVLSAVVQLADKAHSNHRNTFGKRLPVNLIAQSNRGVIHLDFDGVVRDSGRSGECAPHVMLQKIQPDTRTSRTNFVTKKNIGTIHLY